MKQLLLAFAACSLLATSCQKNESPVPENPVAGTDRSGKKYPVEIKLQQFMQHTEPMEKSEGRSTGSQLKDPDLATKVNYIQYRAFEGTAEAGNMVSSKTQTATANPDDFGSIRDSLPVGNYIIYVAAAQGPLTIHNSRELSFLDMGNFNVAKEIFTKRLAIQVTENGGATVKDLTLERCVGKLELRLLDGDYQASLNRSITAELLNAPYRFDLENGVPMQETVSFQPLISKSPTLYETYTLAANSVVLRLILRNNNPYEYISHKEVLVNIQANRKTIVTGYIEQPPQGSNNNWDVNVSQEWLGDSHIAF